MSLHDVDKQGDRRDRPQLNHSDQSLQRPANGTPSVNYVTDASTAPLNTSGFLRIIKSGTTTLNYPASAGSVVHQEVFTTLNFNQGIPLVYARRVYTPQGTKAGGGIVGMLPQTELSGAGAIQLYLTIDTLYNDTFPQSLLLDVTALVPTTSVYYATNNTWYVQWFLLQQTITN